MSEKNGKITIDSNNPDKDIIKIINFLNKKNIVINKIRIKEGTLEEIFIKLTNE